MKKLLVWLMLLSTLLLTACGVSVEARNAGWAADIEYVQKQLLRHPTFKNYYINLYNFGEIETYERALQLQTEIKDSINSDCAALIERVPELTNLEIQRELMRIVTLVSSAGEHGDGHTLLLPDYRQRQFLPVMFACFGGDYYAAAYYDGADYAEKDEIIGLLGCRLVSVNGYAIVEVEQRIAQFINHDNYVGNQLNTTDFLLQKTILEIVGVAQPGKEPILFAFEDSQGIMHELKVKYTIKVTRANELTFGSNYVNAKRKDIPPSLAAQSSGSVYTFKHVEEQNAYYIQITTCELNFDQWSFKEQLEKAIAHCNENDCCNKLIIDLRNNNGGNLSFADSIIRYIFRYKKFGGGQELYVLVNRRSYSAAVALAHRLREDCGATIVGEPTSGGVDIYTVSSFEFDKLPYSKMLFRVSSGVLTDGNFELFQGAMDTSPLEPDIYIPTTIEDYINNRDPVLDWVLAQKSAMPSRSFGYFAAR